MNYGACGREIGEGRHHPLRVCEMLTLSLGLNGDS